MAVNFETELIEMLPAYLSENQGFVDLISAVGAVLDEVKAGIDSLATWNVDEMDPQYIQHLADQLGYQIARSGAGLTYSEAELRRLLKAIPTLYSLKGTAQGFEALIWYYYGVSVLTIMELWTKDYASFKPYLRGDDVPTEDGGEWYVSPHVLMTLPSTVFETLGALVGGGYQEGRRVFDEIVRRAEDVRPAHAVLHWALEWTQEPMGTIHMAPLGLDSQVLEFTATRAW